jgi:HEPN domain-containing protein
MENSSSQLKTDFDKLPESSIEEKIKKFKRCLEKKSIKLKISNEKMKHLYTFLSRTIQNFLTKDMEKILEYAKKWLEIAKKDKEASIVLYKNGYYPQSVFFLQQTVEKRTKGFLILFLSLFSSENIKDLGKEIGHAPHRFLTEKMKEEPIKSIIETFYEIDMIDFIKEFKNLETKKEIENEKNLEIEKEIAKLDAKNIEKILDIIKSLRNKPMLEKTHIEKIAECAIKVFKEIFEKIGKEKLENLKKVITKYLPDLVYIGILYFTLSSLVCVHEVSTRYPDTDIDLEPSKYTEDLGIVKAINKIYNEILEKDNDIKILEEFIRETESL